MVVLRCSLGDVSGEGDERVEEVAPAHRFGIYLNDAVERQINVIGIAGIYNLGALGGDDFDARVVVLLSKVKGAYPHGASPRKTNDTIHEIGPC